MLVDRKKFDVGKAEVARVARELVGELAIGQPFIIALSPPRAQVDLVDRHRRGEGVDIAGRRARMRYLCLVEDDGCRARAHFGGKGQRIGFQGQMLALRADDVEFIVIADGGVGHEQFPIADAAHAHRMPPWIPEVEIADHADPPRVRSEHHEGDAGNAVQRHRMHAELVVNPLMSAFTQQVKVKIAQDRRKAVGIVEIDHGLAEAGAQLITPGAVRQCASEQAGIVYALEFSRFAMLADRLDIRGFGQERAHDRLVALLVKAEIVERIGVTAFDDRIGLRGQFGHEASFACKDNIRSIPLSGTRSQSGR